MTKLSLDSPVLVTGATGYIASHVVNILLKEGYKVRGTVRNTTSDKANFLRTLPNAESNLELVQADLMTTDDWPAAVKDIEYLIHVSSPYDMSLNKDKIIEIATTGVKNVYNAAFSAGSIKRIVLTSSMAASVFGHNTSRYSLVDENGEFKKFDETDWSEERDEINGYIISKLRAEKLASQMIENYNKQNVTNKITHCVINPSFVVGPVLSEFHKDCESSRQLIMILLKQYPAVPNLLSSHVDVRDVALAHVRCMEAPHEQVDGQRFLLATSDGDCSFKDMSDQLRDLFGKYGFKTPNYVVPDFAVNIGKYLMNDLAAAAPILNRRLYVDGSKASKLLNFEYRPLRTMLNDHALSLMKYKVIPSKKVPQEIIEQVVCD